MANNASTLDRVSIKSRRQMIEKAKSVRAIVDAMGGVQEVADTVGVQHPSVCQWVRENRIPQARVGTLAKNYQITRATLNRFVVIS
jgi:excisionase family DNA binding protein